MTQERYELQAELETLFAKNQLMERIRSEITGTEGLTDAIERTGIPVPFGVDLLAQMALHKRCDLPTLVGCLRHHFNDMQQTVDMIHRCIEEDLVDWKHGLRMLVVKYVISQDVQDEIDRYQYPLPMVVRPIMVMKNNETGYLTLPGSIILKKNHHNDDVCLDHINRMNGIKFTINHDTATMVKNDWRDLDKAKEGETKEDFEKRKRAFEKYDRTSKDVMDKLLQHGNEFYLTHKYDKRGRTYCQGYHVNYQGTAWNKAVVEFANQEITL